MANHSEVRLEGALSHLGIASLPEFTARAALASAKTQESDATRSGLHGAVFNSSLVPYSYLLGKLNPRVRRDEGIAELRVVA